MAEDEGIEAETADSEALEADEPLDEQSAHRLFSVYAFNSAWDSIEKEKRSPEDIEEMISLAHVSSWHWTQRDDVGSKNRAISAWQLSRVYAEAGRFDEAERYANQSLEIATSGDVGPVFTGYAYEALARLAGENDQPEKKEEWLTLARAEAEKVDDPLDRNQLVKDLDELA